MCLDFDETGWCGHMAMKCWWLPLNVHGGGGRWNHEYEDNGGMWGTGIKIGQKCQCGKETWTKHMDRRNLEAIDHITSDANLNRI